VLDLGCGRGKALHLLAQWYPNSRFTGYDFSGEAITWAQAETARLELDNIHFEEQDAAALEEFARYDLVATFDAVHDQARPDRVLCNIARALRPDGVYLMQDIRASSHLHGNVDAPWARSCTRSRTRTA
jgi:cyclopropane fatty-acyl-phospholipid synthase-like methyltransferase